MAWKRSSVRSRPGSPFLSTTCRYLFRAWRRMVSERFDRTRPTASATFIPYFYDFAAAYFLAHRSERGVNDNIRPGAVNDRLQLGLLLSRHLEFIQRLLKIVQECFPFLAGNLQVRVRVRHRLAGILLWTAAGPAHHLGHQVLESRRRHAMVRLVHQRIRVQSGIYHDSVDQIVYYCSNAAYAPKSFVQGGLLC